MKARASVTTLCPLPRPAGERASVENFRDAMRHVPGGVALVTFGAEPDAFALIAISVAPLSSDPPRLLVCLDRQSAEDAGFKRHRRFGVSILAAQHQALAERCTGTPVPIGEQAPWRSLATGTPVIEDSVASFDCEAEEVIERHGQAILIGRVLGLRRSESSSALIYWRGGYDQLGWTEQEIACAIGLKRL